MVATVVFIALHKSLMLMQYSEALPFYKTFLLRL